MACCSITKTILFGHYRVQIFFISVHFCYVADDRVCQAVQFAAYSSVFVLHATSIVYLHFRHSYVLLLHLEITFTASFCGLIFFVK